MNPNLQALLRAILAHPGECTPRLEYADLLDEEAGHETPRARFIRAMVREPEFTVSYDGIDEVVTQTPDQRLACQVLQRHGLEWLAPYHESANAGAWQWRCGFVEWIVCRSSDWLRLADEIVRSHPVTLVALATCPAFDSDGSGLWWLPGDPEQRRIPRDEVFREIDNLDDWTYPPGGVSDFEVNETRALLACRYGKRIAYRFMGIP